MKGDFPQNSLHDAPPARVSILFEERTINFLFAELLESFGVETEILQNSENLREASRVITEPQFFKELEQRNKAQFLVVGNKNSLRDVDALCLSRPLTEEKVERALREFLNAH